MSGPEALQAALNRARRLAQAGDLREAIRIAEACAEEHSAEVSGWLLASELCLRAGNGNRACHFAVKAAGIAPDNAPVLVQLGRSQAAAGDLHGARSSADAAAILAPEEALLLDGIGAIYSACEEQSLALSFFERATALAPGNPHFLFNLASALRFAGRFAEAETAADAAIAANPRDCGAWHLRSDLRGQTPEHNHVAAIGALLKDSTVPWHGRVQLCYALAKEYEDLGDYWESFSALSEGAALRRRHMDYDVGADIRVIDRLIATHHRGALDRTRAGYECSEPIFVLGLPRSGTTLAERILAGHSAVTACGELRHFPAQLVQLAAAAQAGRGSSRDELVEISLELDMRELGKRYVDSTRPRTGSTPRFTDKMPLNYLYCGLIHAALPRARIIHLHRHPLDACYAVFKTLFSHAYPFSYELQDLARYYAAYRRLMSHWHAAMPGVIHDLAYENLVQDPERETRRLLEYCGLDFEPACLDFHLSGEASTTASAVQVRRPVYQDSVGRWRHLSGQLAPLARMLAAEGIEL